MEPVILVHGGAGTWDTTEDCINETGAACCTAVHEGLLHESQRRDGKKDFGKFR